jgi:putative oxidoreductase
MRALIDRLNDAAATVAGPLQSPLLLALRVYVAWQFLKSGVLKLEDWDTTLSLFQDEYRVPLLAPGVAAVLGTAGELVFPALLIAGFLTRYAALGLSFVNVMAVVSYAHVLYTEGFEAALAQHYLWGTLLLVIIVFSGGWFAVDAWLTSRLRTSRDGAARTIASAGPGR